MIKSLRKLLKHGEDTKCFQVKYDFNIDDMIWLPEHIGKKDSIEEYDEYEEENEYEEGDVEQGMD
jgi:hypothetical protein